MADNIRAAGLVLLHKPSFLPITRHEFFLAGIVALVMGAVLALAFGLLAPQIADAGARLLRAVLP